MIRQTDTAGNVTEFYDVYRAGDGSSGDAYYSTDQYRPMPHSLGVDRAQKYGQFKRYVSANGTTVVQASYDANGYLTAITRSDSSSSAVERYSYAYANVTNDRVTAAGGSTARLISSVTLERSANGGTNWSTVRSVAYSYYTGRVSNGSGGFTDDQNGRLGDLKLVEMKDSGGTVIDTSYYRYYKFTGEGSYSATSKGPTNVAATTGGPAPYSPIESGYSGADYNVFMWSGLKSVVSGASFARLAATHSNYQAATDAQLKPFVDHFYRYERWNDHYTGETGAPDPVHGSANYMWRTSYRMGTKYRVIEEIDQGAGCSTCSGGQGNVKVDYYQNMADTPTGSLGFNVRDFNVWRVRTTEYLPDTTNADANSDGIIDADQWGDNDRKIIYVNEMGTPMLSVLVNANGTSTAADDTTYANYYRYDDAGRVIVTANPEAVVTYNPASASTFEQYPDLVNFVGSTATNLNNSVGLIQKITYGTSTTATSSTAGDVAGYVKSTSVQQGDTGTAVPQSARTYKSRTDSATGAVVYPVASETQYRNTNGTGGQTTSYAYAWVGSTTKMASKITTFATVTTAQNGSNTSTSQSEVYNRFGQVTWSKDADGFINYAEYDVGTGTVTKTIIDVDTSTTTDEPGGWTTPAGGGLHLITTLTVDGLGRTTKEVNPSGEVTHTFYKDSTLEKRVYRGWNATTGTTTGPIEMTREYRPAAGAAAADRPVYRTSMLSSIAPGVSGSAGSYVPSGTESLGSAIQSLTRQLTNDAGQVVETIVYTSTAGATYSATQAKFGTAGTNYLVTETDYDGQGRLKRVESPDGTITRTLYDVRGLVTSEWKGTDDTPTSGFWSPTNQAGTNLLKVASATYDVDGNALESREVLTHDSTTGADLTFYATENSYDFRDRLLVTRGLSGVAMKYTYDNLSQATTIELFADSDGDLVLDGGELRGKIVNAFDERGQVYSTSRYEVSPSTGTASDRLTSLLWYDGRGNNIKTREPSGLFNDKVAYDGAGRQIATYIGRDLNELVDEYGEADDRTGDTTIEQVKTIYDDAGRPIVVTNFKRNPTIVATGPLENDIAFAQTTVYWYDDAGRVTTSVNYGRDNGVTNGVSGGTLYVFSSTGAILDSDGDGLPNVTEAAPPAPNSSDDYIVTKYEYDDAGRLYRQTDNLGRITQFAYDLMGRQTKQIDNYVNGAVAETETDTDRTTEWVYGTTGNLSKLVAKNPKGSGNGVESQETEYLHESNVDRSWVTNTIYPDSADTTSAGTDQIEATYDRLGRKATSTDQRGVVHTYTYDLAGRLASDAVTTLPSGVDGAVRRIGYTYDSFSRPLKVTSYDASVGGNIVNEIEYTYDGWGNVTKVRQSEQGAVVAGTTPSVDYTYVDGASAGEARYVRLQYLTYPDGRQMEYVYPTEGLTGTGSDGFTLSRWYAIENVATGVNEINYSWIGSTQLAYAATHAGVTGGLSLDYGSDLAGWDRFGRVIDQRWTNTAGTTDIDRTKYTYDRNSNRLTKDVQSTASGSNHDEAYTYDGLNRLATFDRGTFTAGTLGSINFSQDWNSLDSLGNWKTFTEDTNGATAGGATAYSRAHNAANELTDAGSTWVDPTYDAAGNMTKAPVAGDETVAQYYFYDGWNRLVGVSFDNDGNFTDAGEYRYEYDGQGRRIVKDKAGSTADDLVFFHSTEDQVLEVRKGGDADPLEQYVWGAGYVDEPVVRYYDGNMDGDLLDAGDNTLYPTYDANHNVTAVVNASGTVVERYEYSPYGDRSVLEANYAVDADNVSDVTFNLGHQGLLHDTETALVYNRARLLHVALGRFLQRDPAGYIDGANVYQYVSSNPSNEVDPMGLQAFGPLGRLEQWHRQRRRMLDEWQAKQSQVLGDAIAALCPTTAYTTANGTCCPPEQCQAQARQVGAAIAAAIRRELDLGDQSGGVAGNLMPGTNGCGDWQVIVNAAIESVLNTSANNSTSCFNVTLLRGSGAFQHGVLEHQWVEIAVGANPSLVIDPWPSGGSGDNLDPSRTTGWPNVERWPGRHPATRPTTGPTTQPTTNQCCK